MCSNEPQFEACFYSECIEIIWFGAIHIAGLKLRPRDTQKVPCFNLNSDEVTVRVNLNIQKSFCGYNYIQKLAEQSEQTQTAIDIHHLSCYLRTVDHEFLLSIKSCFANKEIYSNKDLRHTCVADSWRQLFRLVYQSFIFIGERFNRGGSLSFRSCREKG